MPLLSIDHERQEPATEFDFFTGGEGKTPDFTIYYNVALDALQHVQRNIAAWPLKRRQAFLVEYFWKAHLQQKNSNGYQLTDTDTAIIRELCDKVEAIRNFYSHIWHDNEVLSFSTPLKKFVELKYEEAKAALFAEHPHLMTDYEHLEGSVKYKKFSLFKKVPEKRADFITEEGRIFFLSFFLTTGQMNQFLQQRKGFKRSDMPLFKMKRMLYTFYCHRDGATITSFNQEGYLLDDPGSEERNNILKARTAYKLVNYLFNYPTYWANPSDMPIFNSNNEPIADIAQLKSYIEEQIDLLPGFHFSFVERRTPPEQIDSLMDEEKYNKLQEDKFRKGVLNFYVDSIPDYYFQIDYPTLYRLVLMELLHRQEPGVLSPAALLIQNLQFPATNRRQLYQILTAKPASSINEWYAYLTDKSKQFLRGDRHLTELGIIYFEKIEKGNKPSERELELLASFLRPISPLPGQLAATETHDKAAPEPIHVYQQDFIMTTSQHFRAGNRFMYYAAKYLQDFAGDFFYWGVERFEMGQKGYSSSESLLKIKSYLTASEIAQSEQYRLTIEDDHVYIAVLKDEHAQRNHDRFYQFAIGPQALRYLMAYLVDKKDFGLLLHQFLETLAYDIKKLHATGSWKATDGYSLLEEAFVPAYLKGRQASPDELKKAVHVRINHIITKWKHALENKYVYSRSEKNRLIMDAYRLFDWPAGNNGHPRFLRASEYNAMSVCHYSLHLKEKNSSRHGAHNKFRKNKFDHLYDNIFRLNQRKPPIPFTIEQLLDKATSLDHLLELVLEQCTELLRGKIRGIQNLPTQLLKKELSTLCRLIGISIPANLVREQERNTLRDKHAHTMAVQPFPIPPALVVKHFFAEKYMRGKPVPSITNKDGQVVKKYASLDIFSVVRKNQSYRKRLHEAFYEVSSVEKLYPHNYQKKTKENLIGIMNTTCTEDILLWRMAQDYLSNNQYTQNLALHLQQVKDGGLSLSELLKLSVTISLEPTIHCSVLMHQLDDLMFLMHRKELSGCAKHFLNRYHKEYNLWKDEFDAYQTSPDGAGLPDGSRQKPLPFELLRRERELIWRTGRAFAGQLLQLERRILNTALEKHKNKLTFHNWLIMSYQKSDYSRKHPIMFFNFELVLKLAIDSGFPIDESLKKQLNEYRNITFHNDIPVSNSFSWLTRQGEAIRTLLDMEQDLHARKDRSIYEL